ncbi:type III-A CRISPR-associated protein Cas10/Csm1 [Romboutsia maritimum]|uniref:CRISPR system single-strand-specific deoxyribonuclease Cas10/Csm1 (subtype III-A) n=1 Tax=Romboutsia maritimum TaxID=2020948 RepID=A0A371ITK8_9FIRM|nr:type III-A CRISPR-associated protein Cas10/Csm1 [Romboutsia maritimum]RDY23795.1 type III-A CRISPR-associated protein Cas10/Csm1 [Romboutsia maritimum]
MLSIKNDYEAIVLGGLLHDIGKLLHRCDIYRDGRKYKCKLSSTRHQALSADFLDLLEENNILKKNELLKTILQRHHEDFKMESMFKVQDLKAGNDKTLAYIISRADNYSSAERSDKEGREGSYRTRPLDSVLHTLSITNDYNLPITKYKLNPFSYKHIFPQNFDKNEQEDLTYIVRNFIKEVKDLKCDDFNSFYITMYNIIKKYTWCLASDTQSGLCDISLFDHLKTTSAIGVASYLYHLENNTLDEKSVKNNDEDKFMVVGFRLEGSKNYIEDIRTNKNSAKRLRGKSFYINILTQAMSYKIINNLNLTISNIVLNMGDKFYIIAPKSKKVQKIIKETRQEINDYLYNKFEGELYLNLAAKSANGNNLKEFTNILDDINYGFEKNKNKVHAENVLLKPIINHGFEIGGMCSTCEKMLVKKNENECEFCKDEINIGTYLSKAKYIGFYNDDIDYTQKIKLFSKDCMYVAFYEKKEDIIKNPYIIYNIQNTDLLNNYPNGFKFYANYVPTKDTEVLTFEEISSLSKGVNNIGVLKIGMDDLDMLMSIGLIDIENKKDINELKRLSQEDEGEEKLHDYTTISRLSTLNENINAFLNNYIYNTFKNTSSNEVKLINGVSVNINLSNQYVLNNTNDTITIVGPWNEVIFTAKFINDEFKKLVSNNKDVTLSCGISIIKNKEPIMSGLKEASDNLEKSKANGGNGLIVFDKFINWDKFDEVFEFGEFVYKNMRVNPHYDDSIYAQSFVYRLLNYTNMANEYKSSNGQKLENLMYISKFTYDISRNLVPKIANIYNLDINKKEDKEKLYQKSEIRRLVECFEDIDFLYRYMNVVLNYAVRKNRGDN